MLALVGAAEADSEHPLACAISRGEVVVVTHSFEDGIRPESGEAVKALHEQGIRVVMITGDAKQFAEAVAKDLGIDEVFAEVLPEDNDKAVAELQQRGERVAMVGDVVNDVPVLVRAKVGTAIGAGTDVVMESAGVVLAQSDRGRYSPSSNCRGPATTYSPSPWPPGCSRRRSGRC